MLLAFVLGILLAVLVFLLLRWFAAADPAALMRSLRRVAFVFLAGVLVALVFAGRGAFVLSIMMLALPFLPGLLRKWRLKRGFTKVSGGGPQQASTAETRFLAMSLDHESGTIDGVIRQGPHAGRQLGSLSTAELSGLWQYYSVEDPASAQMLEAYLDRLHPDWRDEDAAAKNEPPATGNRMTHKDALRVLGLADDATEAEIREAYRRLIARVHPDHGGSAALAAEINRARDVLLGKQQ